MPRGFRVTRRSVVFMLVIPLVALSCAVAAVAVGVRLAPDDPGAWHTDPLTVEPPNSANWYLMRPAQWVTDSTDERQAVSPVFDVTARELAVAFDAVARDEATVEVLDGSPDEAHVTYLQRSRVMGFPDYVSVRFLDEPGETSTVAIYSRARYGHSDLGVNEQRVTRWVRLTQQRLS